jgi:signal transduction histidine kinase
LDNAVKFTEKGSIHINCELEAEQNAIRINITDTGIGIPEDKQEQIFERFYKVDSFSQGIGLGLSVSRMIAQKLGGNLVLDSSYKEGSRFVVTIPIA